MTGLLETTAAAALRLVAQAQADGRIPSLAAGVVRDGEVAWTAGRGTHVRRGSDTRPDADTQYKIGSVTKTMTAALVMLARERGQLALGDTVGTHWPEAPYADATLRSLLSHSAGLTAEPHGPWWERTEGGDLAALVAAHSDAGASYVLEPGSRLHYSNLGYGLLGGVVEKVWGRSWWEVLQAEILQPLGMTRTSYQAVEPAAEGFSVDALTGEVIAEPLPDTGAMAPAGQLWSTVADLGTWLTALVDADRSVLSQESLDAMATPQSGEPGAGQIWGLGVAIDLADGHTFIGHGGSMPGFSCNVLIEPESRIGAVVLTNAAYGLNAVAGDLVDLVLAAEPPLPGEWAPTTGPVAPEVREILGTWHWGHAPMVLRWTGSELSVAPPSGPGRRMSFAPRDDGTWRGTSGYLAGETLRVHRREDGTVGHLECATFVWTRTPYDPQAPIPGGVADR